MWLYGFDVNLCVKRGSLNCWRGIILFLSVWLAIVMWPLGEFPISQREAQSACCAKATVQEVQSLKGAEVWEKPRYRCLKQLDCCYWLMWSTLIASTHVFFFFLLDWTGLQVVSSQKKLCVLHWFNIISFWNCMSAEIWNIVVTIYSVIIVLSLLPKRCFAIILSLFIYFSFIIL